MRFPPFRLDIVNQCLWRDDLRIRLTPKPFAVLRYLVEHAGRLVTHDELIAAVWPDTFVQPEVLRRYILEIRRALCDNAETPAFIETLPKRGYQFIAPVIGDAVADRDALTNPTPPLVGRATALADLDCYLARAVAGRRQLVFVVGEPGIGKTSLADAFERSAVRNPTVRVARGQSVEGFGGKEAYYPIFEALSQLVRGDARSLVLNTLATHAPTWLVQFPHLVQTEQQAALQRQTLGATRERMVRELCEALEAITQSLALVLILEDLHWVDHSTLDFISAIARRREPARLLVLGTFRAADLILSESPLKGLRQDLLQHRLSSEVTLERLQESDVAEYLATEFGAGDLPSGLAAVIHRQSEGNPLFMTAMLDHLTQQGVLLQTDGRWRMTIPIDQVDPGVPETLRQMLEVQLQHASARERQLLTCASVVGQYFTAWSVATMLRSDWWQIEDELSTLAERQQFLKSAGPRELPNGIQTSEYEFRHVLYREVVYRSLHPSRRVNFHRRLADGLEGLHAPADLEMAAKIALHWEEGGDDERATRYLILAAQNATRRYAHREAIATLEHARDLLQRLEPGNREQFELQILERIGRAYYALGDMGRSAEHYRAMATLAAHEGLLADQAEALIRLDHPVESIPFFLRAIELDSSFVSAYVILSRIYSNLGDATRAKEYATLAYERREQAGKRDRLSITYQYHYEVTGNQLRATETLETWKQSFPQEFRPVNSLALIHNFLGQFERAIGEGLEAVRRNPSHGYPYSNLSQAYRAIGRFEEAQKVAERAVELNLETLPTRCLLYQLAVLAGDKEAEARQVAWVRDKPREFDLVVLRAQVAGHSGKIREARELYEEAARMAEGRNLPDIGTLHLAWSTWMEWAFGNKDAALREARRVLACHPGYDARLRAALTLALTGGPAEAAAIASEMSRDNPEHTFINSILVPIVRAGVELGVNQPARAIEQLRVVAPYELGFVAALAPIYLRGLAYLLNGCGHEAAKEFQRIVDHRGVDPFSPFHAVAPLALARAHAMRGDTAASLQAYERFFAGWADADSDVPVMLEAREEHDRYTIPHL
jgi:DNA-binding winged helix-turn-helix (wHTH) protein/tetratricopeptide (TPR) repeat protein